VAVATMPKSKGKIPRITFDAIQPINLSDENWRTIEEAYGHSISRDARAQIEVVTSRFLQMSLAENTGSMEDATKRANQLRQRAGALLAAIAARPVGDVIRDYTDDELALSYARLYSRKLGKILHIRAAPLARCKYVSELYAHLERFVNACDLTLNEFAYISEHDYWLSGGAWETWIRELTGILKMHHLPTGVRKDSRKYVEARFSPFVRFVKTLQSSLPKEHIRSRSDNDALPVGLSTAINKARKESKPLVALREKSRARKSGRNT
jgi:hypothetical protein